MTELTKWPRLLVVGEPVTQEQANEILVRTDLWWLLTNDDRWRDAVGEVAGLTLGQYGQPSQESFAAFRDRYRLLDLSNLRNERVMSSWIGGPHGWCDWGGAIGCATYNIGKWPTVAGVSDDWAAIAATFPFLNLRAQLVPDEGHAKAPAVEWRLSGGGVETIPEPDGLICLPVELDEIAVLARFGHAGERGVGLERLGEALAQVRGEASS